MSAPQLDLFGALPVPKRAMAITPQPPRPAASEPFPAPSTLAWARRLTEAGAVGQDVMFQVHLLAQGVCVEALCQGSAGRTLLYADGGIHEIKPDPGAFGRIVYLNPEQAVAIHAKRPLIQVGDGGTHSARYRLAGAGEAAPIMLPLPPGDAAAQGKPKGKP